MASPIASLLDFEHGVQFETSLVKALGRRVHEHHRLGRGQFLLLATFRRYLFQLNEESVALALQSCLGGSVSGFQISYQSHNHFRFTVSCKSVGFEIYKLRRFIGRSFDVYFHLWSNGAPHWECEKRIWEEEEAKQWSTVLTRRQKKKEEKSSAKSVRFAKNLVQLSPKVKSRPRELRSVIKIGEFDLDLSGEILEDQFKFHTSSYSDTVADSDVVSGILKKNVDQHISEPAVSNPSH
jgi:hypothetical protein